MKNIKIYKEKVEIELKYLSGKQDIKKGIFAGGVQTPQYLDEIIIDISEAEKFDEVLEDFVENGNLKVDISGSSRALEELGIYLIALSKYKTFDPDYHDHFENFNNSNGEKVIEVSFRKQKEFKHE
ncbi:MAG TPA: hypothetical protein DCP90_03680 [Clostridiales bacterium]|nr:MAG: hypothetical protein A2Y22_02955 [Clostridiales bacterium GWD2_32_59]HAN09695.1 hypothetical protein [Clostridiales bacterium]